MKVTSVRVLPNRPMPRNLSSITCSRRVRGHERSTAAYDTQQCANSDASAHRAPTWFLRRGHSSRFGKALLNNTKRFHLTAREASASRGELPPFPCQYASDSELRMPAQGARPPALVLSGGLQHQPSCLGVYALVEDRTAHGWPVYKHEGGDFWMAKVCGGQWVVQRRENVGVGAGRGFLRLSCKDMLPHQSRVIWREWNSSQSVWVDAAALKCEAGLPPASCRAQMVGKKRLRFDDMDRAEDDG